MQILDVFEGLDEIIYQIEQYETNFKKLEQTIV